MTGAAHDIRKDIQQLSKLRQYEEALKLCTQALEADSNNYEWHELRSEILKKKGDFEGALSDLERVIELMPTDFSPIFRRGRWSFELGRYDQTILDMTKIIDADQSYFKDSAYYFRSQAFYFCGKYHQAFSDCANMPDDFFLGPYTISRNDLLKKINSAIKKV